MMLKEQYARRHKSFYFAVRLLPVVMVGLIVPVTAQENLVQQSVSPSSTRVFRELWDLCVTRSNLSQAKLKAEEFRAVVVKDGTISMPLRTLLSTVSVEDKEIASAKFFDGKPHPAIGALKLLFHAAAVNVPLEKAKQTTCNLQGRVARHIEYGWFQRGYDGYLSDLNAYGSTITRDINIPKAPVMRAKDTRLARLRSICEQIGDTEWETKALRWQLGAADNLIEPDTAAIWARLGQLESGVAGELDRFLSQVSTGGSNVENELNNDAPVAPEALTIEQCHEVIQLMIDMKMPWEAFLFRQHAKERWNVNLPGALPLIRESWKTDINGGAAIRERALSRPWFIATVKVTPTTTLEEFLKELETRPNLAK